MKTIDSLLRILTATPLVLQENISSKDYRLINSFLSLPNYITEKQSKLILRMLDANRVRLAKLISDFDEYVTNPVWEKSFREIEHIKNLYVSRDEKILDKACLLFNEPLSAAGVIVIEISQNVYKKLIHEMQRSFSISIISTQPVHTYAVELSEQAIVQLIDCLKPYSFNIDDELTNYYNTIMAWDRDKAAQSLYLENYPDSVKAQIDEHIGPNKSNLLYSDRRIRFQYRNQYDLDDSLSSYIAKRRSPKVWVDRSKYSVNDIVKSIVELNRLPMLVVFNQSTSLSTIASFNELTTALTNNGITNNIGVHFRVDNDENGKIFNRKISENQFNGMLTTTSNVAVIQGGKLPKFFLKSDWKPMSILCLDNVLRHSKTAVYAKCCDLVITHTATESIIETRSGWE